MSGRNSVAVLDEGISFDNALGHRQLLCATTLSERNIDDALERHREGLGGGGCIDVLPASSLGSERMITRHSACPETIPTECSLSRKACPLPPMLLVIVAMERQCPCRWN